ncbi:MAG: sulfatase-like hydrolase/transferase [Chloroflexi bacterium]|nr:sulfatase-like hydrolase/transferase [Chloroflexota bacterium]
MSHRPPNILFFLPDQHRPDWLGLNPALPLRTPHIDRLAARGIRFTQAFCPSPLCAPSRAALASGRDYDRCGVINNNDNYPLDQPTYYQALRDAGYRVAGVGKFDLHKSLADPQNLDWHLDGSRLLKEWGFTEGIDNEGKLDGSNAYRLHGGPRGPYLAFLQSRGLAELYVREHEIRKEHMDAYTTVLPDDAYCDNWIAENGLRFLRGFPPGQPWHLVINFTGPHNPMDVTASMRERWQDVNLPLPHDNDHPDKEGLLRNRQNYAAMIENIDRHVGRFIAALRERGELENTLIVYASDHGEMLGDHGRWGKSTWYTPSVGIPLIVAGPGLVQGSASEALVSLHDLTATFLELAGVDPLPEMDAHSLLPILQGRATTHRDIVISGLDDWRMVYDGRYKLVVSSERPPLLYDLTADPYEDRNIADQRPELVSRLREVLAAHTGFVGL